MSRSRGAGAQGGREVSPPPQRVVDRQVPGIGRIIVDLVHQVTVESLLDSGRLRLTVPRCRATVNGNLLFDDEVRLVGISDLFHDPDGDVVLVEQVGVDDDGAPVHELRRYRHDLDAVIAHELAWLATHKAGKR